MGDLWQQVVVGVVSTTCTAGLIGGAAWARASYLQFKRMATSLESIERKLPAIERKLPDLEKRLVALEERDPLRKPHPRPET